jgi:polar amino acid transport system substrate-binding protein
MKNTQVLVTKKSSGITTVDGMKGKILGAQEGSSGYNVFTKQANVLKDIVQDEDATLYASFNEAFIDLEHGRIDGLLVDNVYAGYYLKQAGTLSDYNIIETPYTQESFAVGVRKGDDKLAEKINEGLKTLKENGKYDEIVEKWFGDEATSK